MGPSPSPSDAGPDGGGVDAARARAAYDETPYPADPLAEAQPDRLATVARLHGLDPAPPGRCRVLELGCADGGNLRAAALAGPGCELVGVDLSGAQIAAGRRAAAELGLANLTLVEGDLRRAAEHGAFDYVIAHGLFSWVPPALQGELLAVIGRVLAPGGVAYVSFNTQPGWGLRGAVQAVLARQTRDEPDPRRRAARARALLDDLAAAAPASEAAWAGLLAAEADFLRSGEGDPEGLHAYVTHEVLAEHNHPRWFGEFMELAAAHGLAYVADAEPPGAALDVLAAPAAQRVLADAGQAGAGGRLGREQLADCVLGRAFRRALLCRRDAPRAPLDAPAPGAVGMLLACSAARPEATPTSADARTAPAAGEAGTDRGAPGGAGPRAAGATAAEEGAGEVVWFARKGGGRIAARTPLARAALELLLEAYPEAVATPALAQAARARVGPTTARAGADGEAGAWADGAPDAARPRGADGAADDRAEVEALLLEAWQRDVLGLRVEPPACVASPGARPKANPLARRAARLGQPVFNAHHDRVPLPPLALALLPHLDGLRDLEGAVERVARDVARGRVALPGVDRRAARDQGAVAAALREPAAAALRLFARAGLLVA